MIKVYMDTNMLEDYSNRNLIISGKILSDKFYSFLNNVKTNRQLLSVMQIVVSQVVIDEIKQHIKETFEFINSEIEKIENVYKFINNIIVFDKNEKKVIKDFDSEIKSLIKTYPFVLIEKHRNSISDIYQRAVDKLSPFYKKNASLDSGFKDAVLLKTVIENKGKSKVIICSNDLDFRECGINTVSSFDKIVEMGNDNYTSQKEVIVSFLKQDYIKHRMADELGFSDVETIEIELIKYCAIDDTPLGAFLIEVKLIIDGQNKVEQFIVDMSANEVNLMW